MQHQIASTPYVTDSYRHFGLKIIPTCSENSSRK